MRAYSEGEFEDLRNTIALIFEDPNINYTTKNLRYKIEYPSSFPSALYSELMIGDRDVFEKEFTGLQLCVDQSLIQIKKNDLFQVQVRL